MCLYSINPCSGKSFIADKFVNMSLELPGIITICTILPTIASGALAARLRVRTLQKTPFQIDDWTACGGFVSISKNYIPIEGLNTSDNSPPRY